jgi:hypothetical protein
MAEVGEEDEKESSKGSAAHNQSPTSTHTHITSSLKLKFSANHLRLRLQWYSASNLPFSTAIDMAMFDWDFCFNFIEIGNTRFSLPYREPYHIYSFDFSSFFLKKNSIYHFFSIFNVFSLQDLSWTRMEPWESEYVRSRLTMVQY